MQLTADTYKASPEAARLWGHLRELFARARATASVARGSQFPVVEGDPYRTAWGEADIVGSFTGVDKADRVRYWDAGRALALLAELGDDAMMAAEMAESVLRGSRFYDVRKRYGLEYERALCLLEGAKTWLHYCLNGSKDWVLPELPF